MTDLLAYIDPGMGSLLVQGMIAAAIAVPLFFREQVRRLIGLVRRRR